MTNPPDAGLAALHELFNDAVEQAKTARKYRAPIKRGDTEVIRPLPLADTQFYLRPAPREQKDDAPRKPSWAVLFFPAPKRMHLQVTAEGWWIDQPWTVAGVQAVLDEGGWFHFDRRGGTQHEFVDLEARTLAKDGKAPARVHTVKREPFGDEILEEFWALERAKLPKMSWVG